ncbi:DUF748 domain-containing protein [Sporocytophaga myxococcoides]|uniref:DUF748 domain-containing protein n=1 Tax=Sporocytophaga myxococcoides TaxID=153721 RepID=UPI000400654F|nr:DUF748 domain-containing protein [Sporocytophaga myxococcoides]
MKKKKLYLKIGVIMLGLLIALRLSLPYIVLRYVNNMLSELNGYKGHVNDIDIHLIRGAYTIHHLNIEKTEGKSYVPFFLAEKTDLSVQWKAIFKGAFVGEVIINNCALNFVNGGKGASQDGGNNDWREPVKKLFPLKINRLEVLNGEIHYRDYSESPDINLYLQSVHAVANNLTNSEKLSKTMVADIVSTGKAMKTGTFKFNLQFDPYAESPYFNMDAKMEKLPATELNNFFKAYGKFDVQDGTVGLYIEAAAKDGGIKGYVKPLIENLNVLKPKEEKLGPIRFLYEAAIEGLGEIFKNHPKDRIATKVPFSGQLDNPKIQVWTVVTNLISNAFIKVLLPNIDNTINMKDTEKPKKKKD